MNSPIFDFLNTTANFIALNFVFLITCIPMITIGPALAALYQVMLRESRGENGYLVRKYLKHFREMFVQGTVTFLIYMVLLFVLTFSIAFWCQMQSTVSTIISVVLILLTIITVSSMLYAFPLMARFSNTIKQNIKNAYILSLSNTTFSLCLLGFHIAIVCLLYVIPAMKVLMLLIGFSFFTYCFSFAYTKLFKKYEPSQVNPELSTPLQ